MALEAHVHIIAASVQLAAAALIALQPSLPWGARAAAGSLLSANAVVSLWAIGGSDDPTALLGVVKDVADLPTPLLILLLVLWCPRPRFGATARWLLSAGLVVGAVVVASAGVVRPSEAVLHVLRFDATVTSYCVAVGAFAYDFRRTRAPAALWLYGAFAVRAAQFVVLYATPGLAGYNLAWVLLATLIGSLAWIVAAPVRATTRLAAAGFVAAGAALGVVVQVAEGHHAALAANLLTLTLVRPLFMAIALAPTGVARMSATVAVAIGGYAGGVALTHAIGAAQTGFTTSVLLGVATAIVTLVVAAEYPRFQASLDTPPKSTGTTESDRLIAYMRTRGDRAWLTRAELADALGLLPRNIQRLVDSANRSAPRIERELRRGRGNQIAYVYRLLPATADGPPEPTVLAGEPAGASLRGPAGDR